MVQFRTVIFGSSPDNDEHKAKLVNPTYENPGYIDVDDSEVGSVCGSMAQWLVHLEYELGDPGSIPGSCHYSIG